MQRLPSRFVAFGLLAAAAAAVIWLISPDFSGRSSEYSGMRSSVPRSLGDQRLALWWESVPEVIRAARLETETASNIRPQDYVGAEACRKCHPKNHRGWSEHSHRWMNAMASDSTVKGRFEVDAEISYLGGRATFERVGEEYRMRLERDAVRRDYRVTQTIGSRFFQYYVGTLTDGPEPADAPARTVDHVLPFGYWLERQEWVPVVHVHWVSDDGKQVDEEHMPDGQRTDPFGPPGANFAFSPYYLCNQCHTTFALGDMLVRRRPQMARHIPVTMNLAMYDYLSEVRPDHTQAFADPRDATDQYLLNVVGTMLRDEAPEHAVTLGISCEACHLGCRDHAEGRQKRPSFLPASPHLSVMALPDADVGRTSKNVTWTCGRCHTGGRPQLAAGMATWNSTESDDLAKGACTSQISCINCHNPHQSIGSRWARTPKQDDQSCLQCHQEFEPEQARLDHTHHPAGSAGSRCMNCHMPRLNEGLQDVVRTHMIHSPTNRSMLQANHPNACNLCHVEQPLEWTLTNLRDWYGSDILVDHSGPKDRPATLDWLDSDNESVRLIAADALTRENAAWALDELLRALDDPFLLNRQFTQTGIERMLSRKLVEYGYRYYQTPEERKQPLAALKAALQPTPSE